MIKYRIIVNSLTEYLKVIHRTEHLDFFWYRGQRYSEFQLEPSRFRDKYEIRNNEPYFTNRVSYRVRDDLKALKDFKRAYKRECGDKGYSDIYYIYLMQHYGVPTRLLDFSTNPLVALYFSVAEKNDVDLNKEEYALSGTMFDYNCESSAVYCIDPHYVNRHSFNTQDIVDLSSYNFKTLNNLDFPICIKPREISIDKRLEKQKGVFVCYGTMIHPLDYYSIDENHMLKIIIPNSKRAKIKRQLKREFGIDETFLFPDENDTSQIVPRILERMEKRHKDNIQKIKISSLIK